MSSIGGRLSQEHILNTWQQLKAKLADQIMTNFLLSTLVPAVETSTLTFNSMCQHFLLLLLTGQKCIPSNSNVSMMIVKF